jgi:hypothetical protein
MPAANPVTTKMLCQCRGTQPNPYNVWADIDTDSSPVITSSFCSCPAGKNLIKNKTEFIFILF